MQIFMSQSAPGMPKVMQAVELIKNDIQTYIYMLLALGLFLPKNTGRIRSEYSMAASISVGKVLKGSPGRGRLYLLEAAMYSTH